MKAPVICNFRPLQKWSWTNKRLLLCGLLSFSLNIRAEIPTPIPAFKLNLFSEPKSIDPLNNGASTHFLFTNLYRNLMHLDGKKLKPDLAEFCRFESHHQRVHCRLKKKIFWSDGTPIRAEDFLLTYQAIFKNQNQELIKPLLSLKNADAILNHLKPIETLGVQIQNQRDLFFDFENMNSEFLYALSAFGLSPFKKGVYSGPYLLKTWIPGQKMILENNIFYAPKSSRPPVEVYFISEDSMAFELYQKKSLDFLRRLPTHLIPKFQNTSDYQEIPVYRFDYLGFKSSLPKNLRTWLTKSLDYKELQKIFNSKNRPGCYGIPKELYEINKVKTAQKLCHQYQPPPRPHPVEFLEFPKRLTYGFSVLGGDNHKRAAEYQQEKWKNELDLNISVQPTENKIFESEISKFDIFRKGLAIPRPTCLAALENFKTSHKNNFILFKDSQYDVIVSSLEKEFTESQKKILCYNALQILKEKSVMIPLGQIDFSILANPEFKGWKIDPLFQLDLTNLTRN